MYKIAALSLLAASLVVAPALAQNRFMDEAKEKAARRSDNAAVREAEHPETIATTRQPDAEKPAGSQPPAAPTDTPGPPAAPTDTQPAASPAPAQ